MPTSSRGSVLVGAKPVMNYVLACLTLFHQGFNEVEIKARGRSISKAVDVAQLVLNRFMSGAKVKKVEIGMERLTTSDGRAVNKSTITIILSKA
ncbi:MAG: DNA-binding protein Alba [Thermoprotei archaeon]|nr:MAG: DNA-binding protein Alba [Thermoprotei archaeon]RLF17731.1 MAG: DNA-binding protein Alba [Thermoprotei archaeon]